jgi:predicted ArsR family transcriptional regulator
VNGERQRDAILAALGDRRDGLDVNELGRLVDLHPNTVRWHVGALVDAGLVDGEPERRHARGRPTVVFRLTADGVARGRDEYRLLATMLTDAVPPHAAYETGVSWGGHLRERGQTLADVMDAHGFDAEEREGALEMRRCPFYALAEQRPGVVCTLHRGIIDGALAAAGRRERVEELDAFVEPTLCVARLA